MRQAHFVAEVPPYAARKAQKVKPTQKAITAHVVSPFAQTQQAQPAKRKQPEGAPGDQENGGVNGATAIKVRLPPPRVVVPGLRSSALKGEPLTRETASKTDENDSLLPHNASSAPWSSPPSLQRSISLAYSENTSSSSRDGSLQSNLM